MEGTAATVGIIGLGLMGGSAALRLRQSGNYKSIRGYDHNMDHALKAAELGIVDEVLSLEELIKNSDIILLAIPVDSAVSILPQILEAISPDQLVIDFGSTKEKIGDAVEDHIRRANYVACHPIAGTEHSGPTAAFGELFKDKVNIICDSQLSSKWALGMAEDMMETLGMRNKYMSRRDHDRHIAYVSHLSHISSFMLGKTVLEVEKDEKNIFDMAGSGFASTVRLAKSSPEMWAPIFSENSENIVDVLDAYIGNLQEMKQQIVEKNKTALKTVMQDVNRIRPVLDGETIKQED